MWIKESEPWPCLSHKAKIKCKKLHKTSVGSSEELADHQSLTQKNMKDYFSQI